MHRRHGHGKKGGEGTRPPSKKQKQDPGKATPGKTQFGPPDQKDTGDKAGLSPPQKDATEGRGINTGPAPADSLENQTEINHGDQGTTRSGVGEAGEIRTGAGRGADANIQKQEETTETPQGTSILPRRTILAADANDTGGLANDRRPPHYDNKPLTQDEIAKIKEAAATMIEVMKANAEVIDGPTLLSKLGRNIIEQVLVTRIGQPILTSITVKDVNGKGVSAEIDGATPDGRIVYSLKTEARKQNFNKDKNAYEKIRKALLGGGTVLVNKQPHDGLKKAIIDNNAEPKIFGLALTDLQGGEAQRKEIIAAGEGEKKNKGNAIADLLRSDDAAKKAGEKTLTKTKRKKLNRELRKQEAKAKGAQDLGRGKSNQTITELQATEAEMDNRRDNGELI